MTSWPRHEKLVAIWPCRSTEVGEEELPAEGQTSGGHMPGWMEELMESGVGSLEREKDCRPSDAGEVGPCWAVGAAEEGPQPPEEAPGCRVALPPSAGQAEKCSKKSC